MEPTACLSPESAEQRDIFSENLFCFIYAYIYFSAFTVFIKLNTFAYLSWFCCPVTA